MIAWLFFAPVALATIVFLAEVGLGLIPPRRILLPPLVGGAAVIIPAHDEASIITQAIAPLAGDAFRILVVADNCTDGTASAARAAGAEVIERDDPSRRGKGYALAFARDYLAADPPEVVIILDADCRAEPGALEALIAASRAGRAVQGAYLMRPQQELGAMVALSGFAFLVKNLLRQRGLARLGAPAILTGSGMAFPWHIFAAAPLATAEPVEDVALGIALSRTGHPPMFLGEAVVWTEAVSRSATLEQRSRWERGFLATGWAEAPSLIASCRPSLMWLGLHQIVPPLALLATAHLGLLAAMLASPVAREALAAEIFLLAALFTVLGLAWALYGQAWLRWQTILAIPAYMIWKLPIYAASVLRKDRAWNRTRRD